MIAAWLLDRTHDLWLVGLFVLGLLMLIPFSRPLLGADVFSGLALLRMGGVPYETAKQRIHGNPRTLSLFFLSIAVPLCVGPVATQQDQFDALLVGLAAMVVVVLLWVALTLEPLVRYAPLSSSGALRSWCRHPLGSMTVGTGVGIIGATVFLFGMSMLSHSNGTGSNDGYIASMGWVGALFGAEAWELAYGRSARSNRRALAQLPRHS